MLSDLPQGDVYTHTLYTYTRAFSLKKKGLEEHSIKEHLWIARFWKVLSFFTLLIFILQFHTAIMCYFGNNENKVVFPVYFLEYGR